MKHSAHLLAIVFSIFILTSCNRKEKTEDDTTTTTEENSTGTTTQTDENGSSVTIEAGKEGGKVEVETKEGSHVGVEVDQKNDNSKIDIKIKDTSDQK